MNYTEEDIKKISLNQLNSKHYDRTLVALNGLSDILSKEWVEKELAYFYPDPEVVKALGRDRTYTGISDLEKVVFLWGDLEQLKNLNGFDGLLRKLKKGFRFDNVDLEISIAADIFRLGAEVELEPPVGGLKADCKFKLGNASEWIFVEVSRKSKMSVLDDIGKKLALLVSDINPTRKCVLVVKKGFDRIQYHRLLAWLNSKPDEGDFKDWAVFFSVPHNIDETEKSFEFINTPVSVEGAGDPIKGTLGVSYLRIPDKGAETKLKDKRKQLPVNGEGILFIDPSSITGGFEDWEKQIIFRENLEHLSAVVLLRCGISSMGYFSEIKIIKNSASKNPLSVNTIAFLERFHSVRKDKNLTNFG